MSARGTRRLRRAAVSVTVGGLAISAVVGGVLLVLHLARTGVLGSAGLGSEAAGAVRGAQLHGQVREENEDFAWEIMRKECLRGRGTNCEAVRNPSTGREGLARPQSVVRFARVMPATEASGPPGGSFGAQNLIAFGGNTGVGWRSVSPSLPIEMAFQAHESVLVDRVAFRQTQASPPPTWAGEVQLLVDDTSVGRWTLGQTVAPQEFSFRPVRGGVLRLRVHSRYDAGASFTSLGALAVGLANADPGRLLG